MSFLLAKQSEAKEEERQRREKGRGHGERKREDGGGKKSRGEGRAKKEEEEGIFIKEESSDCASLLSLSFYEPSILPPPSLFSLCFFPPRGKEELSSP